jgi:hypothetical protein
VCAETRTWARQLSASTRPSRPQLNRHCRLDDGKIAAGRDASLVGIVAHSRVKNGSPHHDCLSVTSHSTPVSALGSARTLALLRPRSGKFSQPHAFVHRRRRAQDRFKPADQALENVSALVSVFRSRFSPTLAWAVVDRPSRGVDPHLELNGCAYLSMVPRPPLRSRPAKLPPQAV